MERLTRHLANRHVEVLTALMIKSSLVAVSADRHSFAVREIRAFDRITPQSHRKYFRPTSNYAFHDQIFRRFEAVAYE